MNRLPAIGYLICLTTLLCCKPAHTKPEIEAAMQRYNSLIQTVDADSIASIYTPDGALGDEVRGRDSIRRFLLKFSNIKVLAQGSTTSSIVLGGDSALQQGTYHQTALLPQGTLVNVKGTYTAAWLYTNEGWQLKKMQTQPEK